MASESPRYRMYVEMLLFLLILHLARLVSSAPAGDLISSLPGQPSVTFKQYGGYVTVNSTNGRALFYYFVEAEQSPQTKPITLWLNGGPGCSGMQGAFQEIGPFFTRSNILRRNNYAWNKVTNVLFVDSPAGVGFSYSNTTSDYSTGDAKTAQDLLQFLIGWRTKFPEYAQNDLYIAGESYAGHFVPQLTAAVLTYNQGSPQSTFPVKGILIGNPLFDLGIDIVYSHNVFLWSHGLISQAAYDQVNAQCQISGTQIPNSCFAAVGQAEFEAGLTTPSVDRYNVHADVCVSSPAQQLEIGVAVGPCINDLQTNYMNGVLVQRALHARTTSWIPCIGAPQFNYSQADAFIPILPIVKNLYNSGLKVWIFSGDEDSQISLVGTRQLLFQIASDLSLSSTSPYGIWFQGQQVGGWSTSWPRLTFATVRGGAHMTPGSQPPRALQLFTSFVAGSVLPQTASASTIT